jgi:hypothetical protein
VSYSKVHFFTTLEEEEEEEEEDCLDIIELNDIAY